MKHICSLVLAFILVAVMITPCFSVTNDNAAVTPRYAFIAFNSVSFSINETTNVTTSDATCRTYDNYEIQIVCKLQR